MVLTDLNDFIPTVKTKKTFKAVLKKGKDKIITYVSAYDLNGAKVLADKWRKENHSDISITNLNIFII